MTEKFLDDIANSLEPNTHCCECTPGKHQHHDNRSKFDIY